MKTKLSAPVVREQIIAFADLSGYHRRICSKLGPEETFAFVSDYYIAAQRVLAGSEGRIVKFIGDAMLIVFPSDHAPAAVVALRELQRAIDSFLAMNRHDCHLRIKAHVGVVAAGPVGEGELERFDVCGLAVNHTALLPDGDWVLSAELSKRIG